MAEYTAVELAGLLPNQKAFALPDGTKVVVQIATVEQRANAFNREPSAHLAVQVSAWVANEDGTPKLADGRKIGPPVKNETVLTSAIAEGRVVLSDLLVQMTIDALGRMSNWLAVQAQVSALRM
jgi:hypothetical protein